MKMEWGKVTFSVGSLLTEKIAHLFLFILFVDLKLFLFCQEDFVVAFVCDIFIFAMISFCWGILISTFKGPICNICCLDGSHSNMCELRGCHIICL